MRSPPSSMFIFSVYIFERFITKRGVGICVGLAYDTHGMSFGGLLLTFWWSVHRSSTKNFIRVHDHFMCLPDDSLPERF